MNPTSTSTSFPEQGRYEDFRALVMPLNPRPKTDFNPGAEGSWSRYARGFETPGFGFQGYGKMFRFKALGTLGRLNRPCSIAQEVAPGLLAFPVAWCALGYNLRVSGLGFIVWGFFGYLGAEDP